MCSLGLASSHLRELKKMLLSAILPGGVWNGFLLSKAKNESDVGSAMLLKMMATFSGTALSPLLVELRNSPEFLPAQVGLSACSGMVGFLG